MGLFSIPKVAFWPHQKILDIYIQKGANNKISFEFDLFVPLKDQEVESLRYYLNQQKITDIYVVLDSQTTFAKSFVYDSKIDSIDKKEVIEIASGFVNFPIKDDSIEYKLVYPDSGKTIIQSKIFDSEKMGNLKNNLTRIGCLKNITYLSEFDLIAKAISTFYSQEYFIFYPINNTEVNLILAKGDSVYLTANFKLPQIDIQKTANYSTLYFSEPTKKIFIPQEYQIEIVSEHQFEKTFYQEFQLAQKIFTGPNIPLSISVIFSQHFLDNNSKTDIIKNKNTSLSPNHNMESKKNILPIIAVFAITAAIASVVLWFVTSKNKTPENPSENPVVTEAVENTSPTVEPTVQATPTISANIDKKIKIQVLNATDINGQAALLKEKLTRLGFSNVAVGNSKEIATKNLIQLKTKNISYQSFFEQKLLGYFDSTYETDLSDSSTYDAIFTIGTKLEQDTSPTTKPTSTTTTTQE